MKQTEILDTFIYSNGNLLWKKNGTGKGGWQRKANHIAGSIDSCGGYCRINIKGKRYQVHRLVYTYHHGDIEDGLVIDHIDRDKSNNNINNSY